jgi:hypothetical protein
MSLKDAVSSVNKQWALIALFGLLVIVGGVGTCTKYVGPIVGPSPPPANGPSQEVRVTPNDIWQPLEGPTKHVVPGLELPAPTTIGPSRKFIIVAAKCSNNVRWLISSSSGTPIEALESKLTNSVLIFTTGKPKDTIIVLAYSSINNVPTDTAITFIAVTGDLPPPHPDPDPEPAPNPTPKHPAKLHVTYLLDFAKQTQAISEVINDPGLRKWLADRGHKIHEVSIKDAHNYNLDIYIEGKAAPLLILQAQAEPGMRDGTLVEPDGVMQLYSIQGVKDAVLKATGKKE